MSITHTNKKFSTEMHKKVKMHISKHQKYNYTMYGSKFLGDISGKNQRKGGMALLSILVILPKNNIFHFRNSDLI